HERSPSMSTAFQVTFDAHDPVALSYFWAEALGYVHPAPPGHQIPEGVDPFSVWQEFLAEIGVPESQWRSSSALEDPDADGPRQLRSGPTRVQRVEPEPPLAGGFSLMTVPEGHEFCLD